MNRDEKLKPTTSYELFRCDPLFRENLERCASKQNMTKSQYVRLAVLAANRRVDGQSEKVQCT